jgi:SAM-dependent methyltransferase
MDDFIKRIQNFDLIKSLYSFNLFEIDDIANNYDYWQYLTQEEIDEYNRVKGRKREETLKYLETEKAWDYISQLKDLKTTYGELKKIGVDSLYNFIKTKIDINEKSVFYDIGSGNGKIVLHLSLISNFGKYVGVEIDKVRYLYSKFIQNQVNSNDNIQFINDDIRNVDFSDATFVFVNDLLFDESDVEYIVSQLKPGTHLVSIADNQLTPDDVVELEPTWQESTLPFKYYKIK